MRNMQRILVSIFTISLLSSCGGGSSSARVSELVESVVQGTAVDDLIINGIITGYDSNHNKLDATRSDENGSYRLTIKDYLGVIIVEATCDKDSTMLDPDGTTMACPLDTRLRSFGVTTGRATPVMAHISPLTEMVYQRAQELSSTSITQAAFEQARAEIGEIFGVDPINDDPTKGIYDAIINAVNDVAQDQNKSVQEVVDDIADDISDGSAGESETTKDLADAIKDNNVSNNLTENDGEYTPTTGGSTDTNNDSNISDEEAIVVAKGMFKDLRTSTLALVDYETPNKSGTIDVELRGFGEVVTEFEIKMDTASIYKSAILELIFDTIKIGELENVDIIGDGAGMKITIEKKSATNWYYKFGKDDIYQGYVVVPTDDPSIYKDANNYTQLEFKFNGTLPEYRYRDVIEKDEVESIGLQKLQGDIVVNNENGIVKITLTNGLIESHIEDQRISINKMVTRSDKLIGGAYDKLEEVVFNGNLKHYLVDARIDIAKYSKNGRVVENGGYLPNQIAFNGSIYNTQNATDLEAQIVAEWKDLLSVDQATIDKYAYEALVDLSINGTIKVAQQAKKIVNMRFENYSNGSRDIDISYTGDGMVANVSSNFTSLKGDNGTITVSNHLGIRGDFILQNGLIVEGDVYENGSIITKDGSLIGVVEYREGILIVKYTDGSFESLY
jgi:hypothetical protein